MPGRNLVLPQLDVPCCVDSEGRTAPIRTETEEWMGVWMGGERRRQEERREGKL